jgi:hypothetical protein
MIRQSGSSRWPGVGRAGYDGPRLDERRAGASAREPLPKFDHAFVNCFTDFGSLALTNRIVSDMAMLQQQSAVAAQGRSVLNFSACRFTSCHWRCRFSP